MYDLLVVYTFVAVKVEWAETFIASLETPNTVEGLLKMTIRIAPTAASSEPALNMANRAIATAIVPSQGKRRRVY